MIKLNFLKLFPGVVKKDIATADRVFDRWQGVAGPASGQRPGQRPF
ncbi:hypothetical protein [Larkinella rosea]|nr:hypothetical protein [Larkinella rosea]